MKAPHLLAALGIIAVAAVAGCDSTGDEAEDQAESRSTPVPAEAEQPLSPVEERGRDLFVDNCGSCHTLDAAGTEGSIGPNLDEAQVDMDEVLAKITEGPSVMPENLVSGQDAQDVAAFVAASGPGP
jgi:mono/diheme cytochrome c family protein